MAIISAIGMVGNYEVDKDNLNLEVEGNIAKIKIGWINFESWIKEQPKNSSFILSDSSFDFNEYYKSSNVSSDIKEFFESDAISTAFLCIFN